jgi:hypothetical protein
VVDPLRMDTGASKIVVRAMAVIQDIHIDEFCDDIHPGYE